MRLRNSVFRSTNTSLLDCEIKRLSGPGGTSAEGQICYATLVREDGI